MLHILYIVLIVGFCVLLYGWWDTHRFSVRKVDIELERLPSAFDGFTILQVSDLHNRAYGRGGRAINETIENLTFDIAAITGDLLDRNLPKQRRNAYACAETAAAKAPAYFVQGNHEMRIGHWEETKAELESRGIVILDNRYVVICRGSARLYLCGIQEQASQTEIEGLISADSCTVLLAHHPERLDGYARTGVDLVLSGHAHGGQVRLFGQGLYSPDQGVLPRYTSGVYVRDKTKLYVSRGAGNHSFLPPRVFNRPEIDLITLKTPFR